MEKFFWNMGAVVVTCCMIFCLLYCLTAQTTVSCVLLFAVCLAGYLCTNKMPIWLR